MANSYLLSVPADALRLSVRVRAAHPTETSYPPAEPTRREPRQRPSGRPYHPSYHGDPAYRRHRASHRASTKSVVPLELSSRAIFALSRGFPTMGFAMLDQPVPHGTRERLAEYLK